jgi:hypothetical protein
MFASVWLIYLKSMIMHGLTNFKFGNMYWRDNETGLRKFDQGSGEQVFGFLKKEQILGHHILAQHCDRAIF